MSYNLVLARNLYRVKIEAEVLYGFLVTKYYLWCVNCIECSELYSEITFRLKLSAL